MLTLGRLIVFFYASLFPIKATSEESRCVPFVNRGELLIKYTVTRSKKSFDKWGQSNIENLYYQEAYVTQQKLQPAKTSWPCVCEIIAIWQYKPQTESQPDQAYKMISEDCATSSTVSES